MKKDNIISIFVLLITATLIFLVTRDFFLTFAADYKILAGFIKFFFLATIGDFIGLRIKSKLWQVPSYIFVKAFVWGLIGVVIVLMFVIYPQGVASLQSSHILPFDGVNFFFALFTSIIMNFTFAPTMMAFHRVTDTYLELRKSNQNVTLNETLETINWRQFIHFTVFRTIPFFWIPAHTITFLLPTEYRVIFAAVLGIFLGLLLGLFKNKKVS
ncbi:MAG: hypothetical protein KJ847_06505 [Firmicutes bacterium]|nr:hypothetical protein [Bacillota bacterium]